MGWIEAYRDRLRDRIEREVKLENGYGYTWGSSLWCLICGLSIIEVAELQLKGRSSG